MIKFNFTASNGVRYQLDFLEPYIGPDEMSPYDFFDSDEVYNKSKFVSFEQITQHMKGGHPVAKQGIEGTGSAAEVFGIVINAIIQYVKKPGLHCCISKPRNPIAEHCMPESYEGFYRACLVGPAPLMMLGNLPYTIAEQSNLP
jgi:hypothetical protein